MSDRDLEGLGERERACLDHLEEAKRLGVNFSRYCREKDLSMHQWSWIKRALVRKGVVGGRRRTEGSKAAGFVPVSIAPAAASTTTTGGRIRYPSGCTMECARYPGASWMSAMLSGR